MAERKSDEPNSDSPGPIDNPSDKITSADVARIASPDLVPPQAEQAVAPAATATPIAQPAPVTTASASQHPGAASPKPSVTRLDDVRPGAPEAAIASSAAARASAPARHLTPLAAGIAIAIAAAVGATAGATATAGIGQLWAGEPPARVASTDDSRFLKDSIARLNTDVTALKAAVDTSGRSATTQLVKLGDRLDRFERAQAEPTAKLAKLAEAIDRIERRAPAPSAAAAHDTTGAIAAAAPPPQAVAVRDTGPSVLDGWVVRSVYNGTALIQGRLGVVEVERGDTIPGLGRIENIRRQDGRWVVVTSKGLILAR
ncbi:MAG TPA: hypothetical protein VH249_14690 [Xanthobacteraceae bacterium]|jgi:hypothetical protein|nr:hypothetical protein [Xanthobacteraceae bacterium]